MYHFQNILTLRYVCLGTFASMLQGIFIRMHQDNLMGDESLVTVFVTKDTMIQNAPH